MPYYTEPDMFMACTSTTALYALYPPFVTPLSHLVGQEVRDSYGAAVTVRDATFIDERQSCARVSQSPLWGQAYSRHIERAACEFA